MASNPLLDFSELPRFSQITPEHIEPALDSLLAENRKTIAVLTRQKNISWDNFVQPLEECHDRLDRLWAPVSHLHGVMNSDALREAYTKCMPKLSEYYTELGQNESLYHAYQSIADSEDFAKLETAQQKIILNALRDFKLAGVNLTNSDKQRFKAIRQRLSELKTQFENNILDSTRAWYKHITDANELAGLPESARAQAKQAATQKKLDAGWVFTLDVPSYLAVMSYADNRDLRQEMYQAYVTRASEQSIMVVAGAEPQTTDKWDNSAIMRETLSLRDELAKLVGFQHYAEFSLATKMAESTDQVITFLRDLATRSKPIAEQDLQELKSFAQQELQLDDISAWDVMYVSEKLREAKYAISQEQLKPYFPAPRVIQGMFDVVHKLYDITIKQSDSADLWHKDVSFYEIHDAQGTLRGQFYLDLYARENKRGGAWMADCIGRMQHKDGTIQTPVAFLTCNLTPPIGNDPALFTHQEVTTLFHEFGHGLHHMLTKINYHSVAGINGVAWDAVELPSQFMENWCWEKQALDLFAAHYQTQQPLPDELFAKMQAARNFQSGLFMVRQLEFSLFDFLIHSEYDSAQSDADFIQSTLDKVRAEVAVLKPPAYNRFQHSFSHIFAGGYAAGYYSYKWAEVLSADAFARFEEARDKQPADAESGIFDAKTGAEFLHNILEQGGSQDALELFVRFRGREPDIDALLRHTGIAA